MNIQIVVVAFGAVNSSYDSLRLFGPHFKKSLPGHDIHWAHAPTEGGTYNESHPNIQWLHYRRIVADLALQGYPWIVVQPLLTAMGREFYRFIADVRLIPASVSVGLPLLSTAADFESLAMAVGPKLLTDPEVATFVVANSAQQMDNQACSELQSAFHRSGFPNVYVGVEKPSRWGKQKMIEVFKRKRFSLIHLIPFGLVGGIHVTLVADAMNSWKMSLLKAGMAIIADGRGLEFYPGVPKILTQHIINAVSDNQVPLTA